MTRTVKFATLFALAVGLIAAASFATTGDDDNDISATAESATGGVELIPADSQRLSTGTSGVTFVEFLDFECEACRAAHPFIEDLRTRYGQEITFVVRNFPLHTNSEAAAQAAEAAAAQGQFEEMYDLLFETQPQWGEQQTSQEDVFFAFAEQLELDLEAFRRVYDDPATLQRIRRDQAAGEALGVSGTPTFFLDGELLQFNTFEQLVELFDQALE